MNDGLFITFEGIDGSGKTTQAALLADYCKAAGFDVLLTREPGGTFLSEKIREAILDPQTKEIAATTEALLYASSRAQHVAEIIRPALKRGMILFCDRFMDSSIAYQGYGRCLGDDVRIINEFAVQGLVPDLTFFIDITPSEGLCRIKQKGGLDRIEEEKLDFHERVYSGYAEIIRQNPARFFVVDGTKNIETISKEIRDFFLRWLSLHGRV
ncbi:MAG: dTMP kinase [Clostridia bacterium]|nr:dTMP kinase [Clostridia bacterium]